MPVPAEPARRAAAGAVALLAALLFGFAPAAAQDPVPQDTARVEIPPEQQLPDTLPAVAESPDTLGPPPGLPAWPTARPAGFGAGAWEWRDGELERLRGVTLVELLSTVPGLILTRPYGFGQPVGVSAAGLGGGRLRVFRDGFEIVPLGASVVDLQHIGLADVAGVRVVRSLHETRVELTSFRLASRVPHSAVEAGTGQPTLKLLRGTFARPTGTRDALFAAFDLLDTRGPWTGPPSTLAAGAARWTREFSPRLGAELEFRQLGTAFAQGPYAQDFTRGDVLARARFAPTPALALEALAGRSWRRPGDADSLGVDATVDHAALRAAAQGALGWLDGAARLRRVEGGSYPVPTLDLSLGAGFRPLPALLAEGDVRVATGDAPATELGGAVRLGPFAGLSLFGSVRAGTRTVAAAVDTFRVVDVDTLPAVTFEAGESRADGLRLGAEWTRGSAVLGAAWLLSDATRLVPYGLPFDAATTLGPDTEATSASGVEAVALLPIAGGLRVEGSGTFWTDAGARPYLPDVEARAAIVFHDVYYTGNLEPTLRVEAVHRGAARAPDAEGGFDARTEPYVLFNLYLQIRVIDVRAFLLWENLLLERAAADIPGAPLGPRIHYGVRWVFRN